MSENGKPNKRDEAIEMTNEKGKAKVEITPATPSHASQKWFYVQISFFAMCGCLARIGSDRLFGSTLANIEDSADVVSQSFFSNIFGSFVLGALNGSPMGKTRLAALYKGLTTGFCGSFTTWSKWNQQQSLTLVGEVKGESQMQVLSIAAWFVGFYTFVGSYAVGMDFGKDVGKLLGKHVHKKGPQIANACAAVLLALAVVGFIIGVVLEPSELGTRIMFAALFAPFGASLRNWLSQFKYERFKMPLGTLMANSIGAIVLAVLHVVETRAVPSVCEEKCWPSIVIYAVGTGFCACLTTVSTFMSEIYKLRPEHPRFAYFYAILTVVVCQVVTCIINGVNYAVGF